jgi:uncharacterized protein
VTEASSSSRGSGPHPFVGVVAEYYAWHAKGELRFQWCTSCHTWVHPARETCRRGLEHSLEWRRSTGLGHVFTFIVTHRALSPAFVDVPYATVVIETEEGVRLVSEMAGIATTDIDIGLPVEAIFGPPTRPYVRFVPRADPATRKDVER